MVKQLKGRPTDVPTPTTLDIPGVGTITVLIAGPTTTR